jgi:hypothetical protein
LAYARARSTEVFEAGPWLGVKRNKRTMTQTHGEIITEAACDLGKGVGGARCDEDDVCPAPQFDVEDQITDGVGSLRGL